MKTRIDIFIIYHLLVIANPPHHAFLSRQSVINYMGHYSSYIYTHNIYI